MMNQGNVTFRSRLADAVPSVSPDIPLTLTLACLCFLCSWVNNFGHEGLGLLLETLEKLLDKKQ